MHAFACMIGTKCSWHLLLPIHRHDCQIGATLAAIANGLRSSLQDDMSTLQESGFFRIPWGIDPNNTACFKTLLSADQLLFKKKIETPWRTWRCTGIARPLSRGWGSRWSHNDVYILQEQAGDFSSLSDVDTLIEAGEGLRGRTCQYGSLYSEDMYLIP